MRAGRLTQRGVLQSPTHTSDGAGGTDVTWQSVATVWLELVMTGGNKEWTVQHTNPKATHLIRIYYRADVQTTWRVRLGTRVFNILAKNATDSQHGELILQCEEYVDTGE